MLNIIDKSKISETDFLNKLKERNQVELDDITNNVKVILDDIKSNGDNAVFKYTEKFDNVKLTKNSIKIKKEDILKAYDNIEDRYIEILKKAKDNIYKFHKRQITNSWITNENEGETLGQIVRPLERVGIYSPGGTASYPSSVLMNAVTAKVAGVQKIIMFTPPKNEGVNSAILVAADIAGVDEIYCVGGAQAIGAMAFGTDSVEKVDKIVGPGNIYVNTAKRMVFGYCDIDMFAGPSEILIIADETANPKYIAADLMAQAEHDVLSSSILITPSEKMVKETLKEIKVQIKDKKRKDIIEKSFENYGAAIIVKDINEAIRISNVIAPEHLELCIENPFEKLNSIKNAGALFMGNYSPEPLGDYFAGTNHVIPTSGTAKFFSPLNVDDFVKKTSLIYYTKEALNKVKSDISYFAKKEGLDVHGDAVDIRFEENKKNI
ncbi:MAG: histidinol dehydrogenase [Clostridiales bacterium]